MRSIIIGGGVAGCAIAAALRGVSGVHDSVMIEKRAANDPAGMGFILMPNGLAALDAIAPEFDWRSAGRCIDRVTLCTHDGVSTTTKSTGLSSLGLLLCTLNTRLALCFAFLYVHHILHVWGHVCFG